MSDRIRLFTFSPAWGLPTSGPFGLKLIACFETMGVPYELVFENDVRKGPKRKSPWIEDDGVAIGDTELILEHIARTRGKALDVEFTAEQRARALILQRMAEEHYHQFFEWELVATRGGYSELRKLFATQLRRPVVALVGPMIRRSFKKHLFERGVGRHAAEHITKMGRDDLDALSTWLGDRPFFISDSPSKVDASLFGLLAVSIKSGIPSPVLTYARSKANLVAFVDRMYRTVFGTRVTSVAA